MTESAAAPQPRGYFHGWSLQQRVGRSFLAMFVLLAVLFTVMFASLLQFKRKGDEVINRWQPGFALSQDLLSDLVNQETGLRGYTLGKSESFLAPYKTYAQRAQRDESRMRTIVGGHEDLSTDLERFRAAADRWRRTIAEPYIARVRQGDPTVASAPASAAAKAAFDRVRAAARNLADDLSGVADRIKDERSSALTLVAVTMGVSAVLILLGGFVVWCGLRRSVLDPVQQLAVQTRDVARGAIDQRIVASGPAEIAALGEDVDTMRARIASELARVEQARIRLIERSEDLARSNADLEQFAYVASHDLSEPLRKVANFCQLLERQYADQLDDKARQYIAYAVDGAKRMQVLIGDLLAFSRVGRTTESFEPVDTEYALDRALAALDERVQDSDAEIVRSPLPVVDGDATLLAALFQNLIGNALKYRNPDRQPRIDVTAEKEESDWVFTVSDNGIGIDRQYAERIFTIFQRLHLRDQYGGTGIGLALCRKIVEFHRGKIWLGESDEPGATFHFTIPEHRDPAETAALDEH
jgi:hypothetical protein